MSYDDIRFSWWDDPDDDEDDEVGLGENNPIFGDWGDGIRGYEWDDPLIIGDEEVYIVYEGECDMCGRECSINDSGYCSRCWNALNG